jgi:hypothetical protein
MPKSEQQIAEEWLRARLKAAFPGLAVEPAPLGADLQGRKAVAYRSLGSTPKKGTGQTVLYSISIYAVTIEMPGLSLGVLEGADEVARAALDKKRGTVEGGEVKSCIWRDAITNPTQAENAQTRQIAGGIYEIRSRRV